MTNEITHLKSKSVIDNLYSWVNPDNHEITSGIVLDLVYTDLLLIIEISENVVKYHISSKHLLPFRGV